MEQAFLAIRSAWRGMIEQAITSKKEFQQDADECMSFFNGPYDFLYDGSLKRGDFNTSGKKKLPRPSIEMTINKVAEGVQLFGPTLYHRNPNRRVTPRLLPEIPIELFGNPEDPQTQAIAQSVMQNMGQSQMIDRVRSSLMESYLNYIPVATGLKDDMRDTIDEGIIKGMGVCWTEVFRPVGSQHKLIRSVYDTIDNLLIDPDHESIENAMWCARRCIHPVWEVEAKRGLTPGSLKGNFESHSQSAAVTAVGNEWQRRAGKTNDLLVYWKIWSKMGLGALLRGIDQNAVEADRFGRYVYLEVCENYNFLLNCPPEIWENEEEMYRRVQWETPFWADTDSWPFSYLAFHRVPRKVWPMSHFRPAMGELKFLNWAYSFLASKMQKSSRTFIAALKAAGEELKTKILEGTDFELIEIEQALGNNINQIVQFLDHPEIKGDFLKIIELVEKNFEKRTGLNELLYGESARQFRSAEEANVKQNNMNVRPDDMANKVEDFATEIARKEALAARWHLDGQDILPIFGPVVANVWQQHVATADVGQIIHQLEYRVEAGSARKPNKDKDIADATQAMRDLFPFFSNLATQGNVGPYNTLVKFWGKAIEFDVAGMLLPEPPPPEPPPPEQPKISVALKGEDLATLGIAAPIQQLFGVEPQPVTTDPATQQMLHDEADHEQDMRHKAEAHALAMKHSKEKAKQMAKQRSKNSTVKK